jgi:hypothetical protein
MVTFRPSGDSPLGSVYSSGWTPHLGVYTSHRDLPAGESVRMYYVYSPIGISWVGHTVVSSAGTSHQVMQTSKWGL